MTTSLPMPVVEAQRGSRLADLCAQYAIVKPIFDEYERRLKEITDGIKLELTTRQPDAPAMRLESAELPKPMRLKYIEQWRIDANRLKAERPDVYVRYAKQGGYWDLRGVK